MFYLFLFTVCSSKLDLAFVIDAGAGSEQGGKEKMAETMEFGRRVASAFKVSPEETRIGNSRIVDSIVRLRKTFQTVFTVTDNSVQLNLSNSNLRNPKISLMRTNSKLP